jgi:hypothetical protein
VKWLALVLVFAAAAAFTPGAEAKVPCRNLIYNDWDQDGQIASTYPLACYRDALRHIPSGDSVYTSLEDDIRAAFQAAVARSHGLKVAAQVGHRFTPVNDSKFSPGGGAHPMMDERTQPLTAATTIVAAVPVSASSSGGVPVPLLVLGGVALALVVSGGAGLAYRASRGSGRDA